MNTTEFIEAARLCSDTIVLATRQLCADLDAAHRCIEDQDAEIIILRATDKNTDYAAKWREAQAIVDKLSKTADGVPVTGKEPLYCKHGHLVNRQWGTEHQWVCFKEPCTDYTSTQEDGTVMTLQDARYLSADQCYSTKAAALAAQEAQQ